MALQDISFNEPLEFSIKPISSLFKTRLGGEEEVECLKIARFSKVPKLDFQKLRVNKSKSIKLDIYNPNDYPVIIYIKKPVNLDFTILCNLQEDDYNEFVENSEVKEDIAVALSPDQVKSIFINWNPQTPGNTREVLNIKWEGGAKLQVVLLGICVGEQQSNKKLSKKEPAKLNTKMNNGSKMVERKVLGSIQPETPSRRTTFLVKPQTDKSMKSLSPLSFEKQSMQKSSKSSIVKPKSHILKKNEDNKENQMRRQTFTVPNKEPATRNLFATSTNKKDKTENTEDGKPKAFLKRKSISRTLPKPNLHKGVAMKKLKLVKGPKTSMPRHPMPFAAKNMFYDERWIEKQERGFTNWLNYILTPFEENVCGGNQDVADRRETFTVDASKKQEIAPTREDLSLRHYSFRRKMAQLRRSACILYQSEDFMHVIHKIEKEVECGLIAVRPEKHILADFGIKNQLLKMLLSYNSLWLRIGLEVIYGEMILLHSNNDLHNLSKFISTRLLANPDIAAEYSHPTVPNLFKPGYEEALAKFALKKFLLLVAFLDHAKRNRLIDHDPCLFNKDSIVKASRDILVNFSKDFLKGEGDFIKHLSYMGIHIGHTQAAIDEYDFGIKNIAVDLRDGVRLVRVAELLVQNWTLSSKVRLPAISRLQKVHNVGVALDCLKASGVKLVQDAKCVVDGHREKTLLLLWQIIFHFQVGFLLDVGKLKEEVDYLNKRLRLREELSTLESTTLQDDFLGLNRRDSFEKEDTLYFKSDKLCLLLKWCKSVCAHYDVKIENFTVSFSDGIAFCCLVNFYHPEILPKSLINHETTQTCSVAQQEDGEEDDFFYNNWTKCFSPNTGVNRRLETLLGNEKENYRILNEAIHELGGVPSMLRSSDMINTIPDEKVVITYVSYLCSRLLSIQKETRAARTIQLAWRKYNVSKKRDEFQIQHEAARKIQACYRGFITRMNFLYQRECVIICQSVARRWLAVRHLDLMHAAAYIIQSVYRGYLETSRERYRFLQMRASAIIIQRVYRQHLEDRCVRYHNAAFAIQEAWKQYRERKLNYQAEYMIHVQQEEASVVIQQFFRNWNVVRQVRIQYLTSKRAALRIQKFWRSYLQMKKSRQDWLLMRSSAIKIQAWFRCCQMRNAFQILKASTITIQRAYKAFKLSRETKCQFMEYKQSSKKIQKFWRSYLQMKKTRQDWLLMRSSAIKIQAWFRGSRSRNKLKTQIESATIIQKSWRLHQIAKRQRGEYLHFRWSCILIQANIRRWLVQKQFKIKHESASIIQTRWRSMLHMNADYRAYQTLKHSVVILQSKYRMRQVKERYLAMRRSAILIQRAYRNHMTRCQERAVHKMQLAIIKVQSVVRCYLERSKFKRKVNAVIRIQQAWRGHQSTINLRKDYERLRHAVNILKSLHKMRVQRAYYQRSKRSAIRIQSFIKMYQTRKDFLEKRNAVIKIQSFVRMHNDRRLYQDKQRSVLLMQSFCRSLIARQRYLKQRQSVICLQSLWRMKRNRKEFIKVKAGIVHLQALSRRFITRCRFIEKKKAAVYIQATWREYKTRRYYQTLKTSAVKIQSLFRMVHHRRAFLQKVNDIERIQGAFRRWSCQQNFRKHKCAAVVIQSIFRAKQERKHYVTLRNSAISIQSFYRMSCTRRTYLCQLSSAVIIQSTFRMYLCRKEYIRQRHAVIRIQSTYRMHQVLSYQRKLHKAATSIQKYFKGNHAYTLFQRQRLAAIQIQSFFRMYTFRKEYMAQRDAATKIQAAMKMHKAKCHYNQKRVCVLKIQAISRMWILRSDYLRKKRAAARIQAVVRMIQAKQRFHELRMNTIKIQSFWRAHREINFYKKRKEAATYIQAWYRGSTQQKTYNRQRKAVLCIQAFYRCSKVRTQFKRQRSAAKCIQNVWMMYKLRQSYLQTRHAAIKVQSFWRMLLAKRLLQEKRRSAVMIQSIVRGYLARKRFALMQEAVIKLQSFYRMSSLRERYVKQRKSIVLMQSIWRSHQTHCRYKKIIVGIVKLQSSWRMYKTRKEFKTHLEAIRVIQSFGRMVLAKLALIHKRDAVLLLQRNIRSWQVRKRFSLERRASIYIQAWWKMVQQKRRYLHQLTAVALLQSVVRGHLVRREFVIKRRSALTIQRFYRKCLEKKSSEKEKEAAISIQKTIRMYLALKDYQQKRDACIIIQQRYRAYVIGYPHYLRYHVFRGAVITIQALIRGNLVRKRVQEELTRITWLQSRVRGKQARDRFIKIQQTSLVCQKNARALLARRRFLRVRSGVVLLQSHARRLAAVRRVNRIKKEDNSALVIQRAFKIFNLKRKKQIMINERREKEKQAAACIQRAWRFYFHDKRNHAAISIQSLVRGYLQRRLLEKEEISASIIQTWFRSLYIGRKERIEYVNLRLKLIKAQSVIRMFILRRRYKRCKSSAVSLQRWWRDVHLTSILRREFLKRCRACIRIQSAYRGYCSRKLVKKHRGAAGKIIAFFKMCLQREQFLEKKRAAIKIEAWFKMSLQRRLYLQQKMAVTIIESWFSNMLKSKHDRELFIHTKNAVSLIQRNYRLYKLRSETMSRVLLLVRQTKAARKIESVYGCYRQMRVDRENYLKLRNSAVLIQRLTRKFLVVLRTRREYKAASIIQTRYRGFIAQRKGKELRLARMATIERFVNLTRSCLAVLKLQRWYRRHVVELKDQAQKRREKAATMIQSLWKGHLVRRMIKDARLKAARERIEIANNNATEPMKLCNRTRSALDYLLKVKNLSTVYEALKQLDVSTSLSFRCCEKLIEDNALPVIFRIVNYGNRSLPWISIKQMAFSILMNLAKCCSTYKHIYDERDSLEIITDQMANFRDKKTFIFPMACNLLTVLCNDDAIKQDLLDKPKLIAKFTSFYKLSERKAKMDSKRKQVNQDKEQPYCKTAWHRRASSINSKDPHTAIQVLVRRLALKA